MCGLGPPQPLKTQPGASGVRYASDGPGTTPCSACGSASPFATPEHPRRAATARKNPGNRIFLEGEYSE
ncbi:hypothetical protein ES705_34101 [subsurface metagenome]